MTEQLDVLVIAAHPDDAEIGMGGTIVKYLEEGFKVGICDLTYAEMSSNGTVKIRQKEALNAARILNLTVRLNLGLPDRGLKVEGEQLSALVEVIRSYKPRLLFAPYWIDRHPDHVQCSKMAEAAAFNAKLRNYLPEQEAWSIEQLYYYFINDVTKADVLIDTSKQFTTKMKALEAYASQFSKLDETSVSTPLTDGYLQRVQARDYLAGQMLKAEYAEGFICKGPISVHLL